MSDQFARISFAKVNSVCLIIGTKVKTAYKVTQNTLGERVWPTGLYLFLPVKLSRENTRSNLENFQRTF
jgi:hypothetical protein